MTAVGDLIDLSEISSSTDNTEEASTSQLTLSDIHYFTSSQHHLPSPVLPPKKNSPPPLPPKRNKSNVWNTLSKASSAIDDKNFPRVNTFSPALEPAKQTDPLKPLLETDSSDDAHLPISFEERVMKSRSLNLESLSKYNDTLMPLRCLSTEDLQNQSKTLRPQNRFSCPPVLGVEATTKNKNADIFFADGLLKKTEERNEEAINFCKTVGGLRTLFPYNDAITNPGFIKASHCKNNALRGTLYVINTTLEGHMTEKSFVCVLSIKARELIIKILNSFSILFSDIDIMSGHYVIRFVGYSMYICDDLPLCDYVYVQQCVTNDRPLKLTVIQQSKINRELKRAEEDDVQDCGGIYFEHFFETSSSMGVSERGLAVLLDHYNKEASKLLEESTRTYQLRCYPEPLIQIVKAITSALGNIDSVRVHKAIEMLKTIRGDFMKQKSINGRSEFWNPQHFDIANFHEALQKLSAGVYSLIDLYCKSFNTEFTLKESPTSPINEMERIDPRTISDNFTVRLLSVHRIPSSWLTEYLDFELEVALYYGGNLLCPTKRTNAFYVTKGFFNYLKVSQLIELDLLVKKIPRETKIALQLYGCKTPKRNTDGRELLGWVTTNIYDYNGFLLSGSKLLGLLANIEFNPVATCATNYIERKETALVKVDFQAYPTEVIFPQPVIIDHDNELPCEENLSEKEKIFIQKILTKNVEELIKQEKYIIWRHRYSLSHLPLALQYVLLSAPSWDSESVIDIHIVLSKWTNISPEEALVFLQADFPDKIVREHAVLWLSDLSGDDLYNYLPEIVQALKYEAYHCSALASFLIRRSLSSPLLAHFLFWHLKYYTGDIQFCQRFKIVLSGLLTACGEALRNELSKQDLLVCRLIDIGKNIKSSKSASRKNVLQIDLENLNGEFSSCFRTPLDPTERVAYIIPEESSFFNSFTVPLKIAFKNANDGQDNINVIFKIGDDLRKDLVTMLMFNVMNKLWMQAGLDLKMLLYKILPTGPETGFIEMVPDSATLREIQVQYGLTGSFKADTLALWLQRFNTTEDEYSKAIETFTASAAAYCVATYLLGIGDRHNDNIMLAKRGHLFHIDFSKFMGAVQKFGNISRDRVPFVLTPDMAYVINNGLTMSPNFQKFIEYCCNAFNVIRRNHKLILNLLGLMVYSDIPNLSAKSDLSYVYEALKIQLTDEEASIYFTRLIETSLSSRSTQLNFFIHNVAQIKNPSETLLRTSRSSPLFSFSNKVHDRDTDSEFDSARVVDFQKRYLPEKHYVFVINTVRVNESKPSFIFRRFEDFQELHSKLTYVFNVFTDTVLPELPPKVLLGRSQIREMASQRRMDLDKYLVDLYNISEAWQSNIVHTFLHSYIRDKEEARNFTDFVYQLQQGENVSRVGGKIKISFAYKQNAFSVLVMHAKNLVPRRIQGLVDCYVKCYLLPDFTKITKRKTKVSRRTLNPTFNETLTWDFLPLELVGKRLLQITVWEHDSFKENTFLGGVAFRLSEFNLTEANVGWFSLEEIDLSTC